MEQQGTHDAGIKMPPSSQARARRFVLFLGLCAVLVLAALWSQPTHTLSAEPVPTAAQAAPASAIIFTVDRCPPNYPKTVFLPGEIVYLHGLGFRPWEPIYWDIYGLSRSCDPDKRIAHSRMTADWSGSFCIYCYTVAGDDCGSYKVVVNGSYLAFYEVPEWAGPTATATRTPRNTPTVTATFAPVPYTFSGYVYEEREAVGPASSAAEHLPMSGVVVELWYSETGAQWQLVGNTRTTDSGWFGLSYASGYHSPRFRVVEVDPPGYASLRAVEPPLNSRVLDPNTIEIRPAYGEQPGVMYFYDRKLDPTETPTQTPTVTGTPPTPTPTATPIPPENIRTVVLQQGLNGYRGVEDTYITSWNLYGNYHTRDKMLVRSSDEMAPLIAFDLSFIPGGSTIISATLSLYVPSAGVHPMHVDVYRVYRPWKVEEVNWIEAYKRYKWSEWGANGLGVDRAETPEDGQDLREVGRWYHFNIPQMVQAWLNSPVQNQGLIVKGSGNINVQWDFASSEWSQLQFRPKLTIKYALPPATPTPTNTRRPTATPSDTPTPTATWWIPFGGTR